MNFPNTAIILINENEITATEKAAARAEDKEQKAREKIIVEHEQEQKKKDRLEKESAVRDLLIHFGYMDDPDSFLAVAPMQDFIKANRSRLRTTSK